MAFSITIEKLALSEVEDFFEKTISDFPSFSDAQHRHERALKLATLADFVTARVDGKIAGMIGYYMNQKPLCYISHVSVHADYRRMGLFHEMFNVLEEEANKKGFSLIKLEVNANNNSAISAYTSKGFRIEQTSQNKTYYMALQIVNNQTVVGGG